MPEPLIARSRGGAGGPLDGADRRPGGDRRPARRRGRAAGRDPRPARSAAAARRALATRPARRVRRARAGAGRRWPSRRARGARTARRWPSCRSTRASSARRLDLLEHEVAEIAAARLRPGEADEIRARLSAAQHGEAIARGAAAVREALTGEAARAPATPSASAVREARGAGPPRRRASRPLADRLAGLEAELEDVGGRDRATSPTRSTTIRACSPRSRSACRDLRAGAPLRRRRGRGHRPRRAGRRRARAAAAGSTRSEPRRDARGRASARQGREAAAAPVGAAGDGRRRLLARGRRRCSRSSGFPAGVFEVALGRRIAGARRAGDRARWRRRRLRCQRRRRGRLPARPEPGRAGAAAGADRVRRRAVARRAGDQEVLAEADDTPDARLRRGRYGDRRPQRRPGRAQPVGARAAITRSCASRTCRRSRPMPTPTSGSPSASATGGRSPRSSGSTARAGSSSSPRCSAATRAAPRPWPAPASSSTAPRPGARRRSPDRPAERGDRPACAPLHRPRHRGLPDLPARRARPRRRATIRAYRATSPTSRLARRDAAAWARLGPDAAVGYLAARTRRGRRERSGPRADEPAPPRRRDSRASTGSRTGRA